ncbi:MAG TPA: hypothetical protein VFN75_08145 [Pseudonocardiaceae bacterium]|nr:hypothetical protein [Pseudonocardiaceae bacterium]
MPAFLADHGFDPITELSRRHVAGPVIRELPFVHVFGRSQFTVSYYGEDPGWDNAVDRRPASPAQQ